eukprot:COSAG05_NODE_70_length_22091_cov_108.202164_9_plen_152_part_00
MMMMMMMCVRAVNVTCEGRVARLGECMNNHNFDVPRPEETLNNLESSPEGNYSTQSSAHLNHGKKEKVQITWHPTREAEDISLSQFKFLLTFENNLCDHYMSEKVWKAYGLGVVPVVFAGSGATASLPADDSYRHRWLRFCVCSCCPSATT